MCVLFKAMPWTSADKDDSSSITSATWTIWTAALSGSWIRHTPTTAASLAVSELTTSTPTTPWDSVLQCWYNWIVWATFALLSTNTASGGVASFYFPRDWFICRIRIRTHVGVKSAYVGQNREFFTRCLHFAAGCTTVCTTGCTTGCMNSAGSTTGQAALERSSHYACDVIRLARSKAAV